MSKGPSEPNSVGNQQLVGNQEKERLLLEQASPEVKNLIRKYQAHVRQLRAEIETRKEENDEIVQENLQQNEKLQILNTKLDKNVRERTADLETSKQKLEEQNEQLQEINESKEAMMHMIVHDMKNPLTAVMGVLVLMQKIKGEPNEEMRDMIKDAHIQSIKLRTMMDDILTISKMKSNEFKADRMEVDLISLVQQSVLLMNAVKGDKELSIEFEPQQSELVVLMDFQMIERVINNIINNAIKYAPSGSSIKVTVGQADQMAKVAITDLGEGIPASHHEKVFDMFARVKPQDKKISGTGLGLAFCKLAIDAHEGSIWVDSPAKGFECGTTFNFTLPLAPDNSCCDT